MSRDRPTAETAAGWASLVRRQAARLGVGPGEAAELLQRLPFADAEGQGPAALERWERRLVERALDALETYAARKRAVARLARRGRL
jgi:trans-aconitate methyltransferase